MFLSYIKEGVKLKLLSRRQARQVPMDISPQRNSSLLFFNLPRVSSFTLQRHIFTFPPRVFPKGAFMAPRN